MKRLQQSVVFILSLMSIQVVHAEIHYPVGSYQKSCTNISVEKDKLSAKCKNLDGKDNHTVLTKLDRCLNSIAHFGDIANIDGNLLCLADLPKVDPAFTFPEAETTINQWVYGNDANNIQQHAWGIWAGLTSYVGKVNDTPVRAFETWATPSSMLYEIESASEVNRSLQLDLILPNQFSQQQKQASTKKLAQIPLNDGDTNIFVSVAYNPPAAHHAVSNKLFLQSTLNQYLKQGYTEIPNFPNNAITVKPIYKVIPKGVAGGIYKFPAWPGTPTPAKALPEGDWNGCVYVDINGTGEGGTSIDHGCKKRSTENTFYLSNFIHQKINKKDAKFLSTQLNLKVSEGDYAILVGMHVTTRETKRWAWQTFWWSASPNTPHLPSSVEIAQQRPSQSLDKAAQHYAMAVAYQMVSPAQPITQGKSIGSSVIAYNPHLEAGFGLSVFQEIRKINGQVENRYGVQSNCMTCHNLAMYNPSINYANDNGQKQKPYGTDYYMSINDKLFEKSLKLDFGWSILGNLKLDGANQ